MPIIGPAEEYIEPVKRIHDGADVQFFLQSQGYHDITTFILQLNRSLVPRKDEQGHISAYTLESSASASSQIRQVGQAIARLKELITEAPPDTGPRRFGNVSFRKWHQLAKFKAQQLLEDFLPVHNKSAITELKVYLLGSFGSPQRLDYGTGHELSFIAFLACLWKIGYFCAHTEKGSGHSDSLQIERDIVLYLFAAYLDLVRELIVIYNLEPAGSHGVWGLDDNSFLPYMFGSAQLSQPLPEIDTEPPTPTPISGSLPSSPEPTIITRANLVDKEAQTNLYFGAIKFIYTVKRGPFWEHSPILFDISGIKDGWGKINKGLIKMYDAEVLAKFPVVQHFPFGSLLRWEKDPTARPLPVTTHQASQPLRTAIPGNGNTTSIRPPPHVQSGMSAPTGFVNGVTQAPWARSNVSHGNPVTSRMPVHSQASQPVLGSNRASNILARPSRRHEAAPTKDQIRLAEKKAETITEAKEEG